MPEYLSPGVYVEEISFRSKTIEGVRATTGFVGPCRYGPVAGEAQMVTSLVEFEQIYGDGQPMMFQSENPGINYLWQSARVFFAQGGTRLHISRIFNTSVGDGIAAKDLGPGIRIRARFPGSGGNVAVRLTLVAGVDVANPTVSIAVMPQNNKAPVQVWAGLSLAAVFDTFAASGSTPVVLTGNSATSSGSNLLSAIYQLKPEIQHNLGRKNSTDADRSVDVAISGGHDGTRPQAIDYEAGLRAFENVGDISIVAAPGSTSDFARRGGEALSVIQSLIAHATTMRYRFAVLDCGDKQSIADVRALRAKLDSRFAALYYPWVRVLDPLSQGEIHLPPSGFVAGIISRIDSQRGPSHAPSNEVVALATGFELAISQSQQDVLNPEGINCFRTFAGRGNLLWGARTISSDPELKYVNLRRYLAFLEHSIDRGTQWAVFEANGEPLWSNVRRAIEDFMMNEWRSGALAGARPEQACFVKCDRTTMTQDDIDNGRMICRIGVALVKPAEFVIFRIVQSTAK